MSQQPPLRRTIHLVVLLRKLLDHAEQGTYGREIVNSTGLSGAVVYTRLSQLEKAQWVTSTLEDVDEAHLAGRPARRIYQLTDFGHDNALRMLREESGTRQMLPYMNFNLTIHSS